jgi:glycosyltransferase involved in cell wall biosynthesis
MTKPLRIGLIMQGGKNWIGGTQYIKNIILALSSLPPDVRKTFELCLLYSGGDIDSDTYQQVKPCLNASYDLDVELPSLTFTNRLIWKVRKILLGKINSRISDFCKKKKINFVYPLLTSRVEQTADFWSCPWIPDFQHKYLPQLFSQDDIRGRDVTFKQIANTSPRVVLSSNSAAKDFNKFFPNAQAKIEVLQFRTSIQEDLLDDDPVTVQQKYNLPNRFFLVSNQFWQHKNHKIILEALKILKAKTDKSINPVVVYTGSIQDYRNPDYINSILTIIHEYDLAAQTYLLGLIPRHHQIQLMRRSIAVIQPSLFEGWSTVIEDARCLGKKMILSDFEVHLEQNPPNGYFFARNSPNQLAELIDEQWRSSCPSPDFAQEAMAKIRNKQEIQEFGYRFLEIAMKK